MYQLSAEKWSLQLPDDWINEEDGECISMYSETGVGALQISSVSKPKGNATDKDLREFMQEYMDAGIHMMPYLLGSLKGYYFHRSFDAMYQRQWLLRNGNLVILITYTCNKKYRRKENIIVEKILRTFKIKEDIR